QLVLSGPAGGVVAAAALGAHHGHDEVISFDMGGTSTDVCRISGGVPATGSGHRVAGRVARVPSVPVRTIGAGGGSIGWLDRGGALRVGPRSAGADPGPAAYGRGGSEPTVTDANLIAGHIPADLALGGRLRLDLDAARRALARLGEAASLSMESCAAGMLEVVDSHMEHALRAVSVEEGARSAYGRGGSEPTVTDANLIAGHIPADLALGGRLRLDLDAARRALARLGEAASLSMESCAAGMLEVVDSHMEHALRAVSVEEGA